MKTCNQQGFSYIDVMMAMVIFLFGIMALLSTLFGGVLVSRENESQMKARHYASSTLEGIMAIRGLNAYNSTITWANLANTTTVGGRFPAGRLPLYNGPGDGIWANNDPAELNTGAVPRFYRSVVITDIPDPERPTPPGEPSATKEIKVCISYPITSGKERDVCVKDTITNYRTDVQ